MDPDTTLEMMQDALLADDLVALANASTDLAGWLGSGGYRPDGLDRLLQSLRARIDAALPVSHTVPVNTYAAILANLEG